MNSSLPQIGVAIRENIQANMDKAFAAIGAGFAKMVVEGKNFGAAMKAVGKQIAESFISMIVDMALKWVTAHILMTEINKLFHIHDVVGASAAAGAGGTASMAAAPFPLNMSAPAFGIAMAADSLSYMGGASAAQGALIDAPAGVGVPITAHGKELILPSHISQGLQSMIANSRGGKGGRSPSVTMNINTPNADSFRASRHQIDSDMHHSITTAARRNA
jgi:hypothetical protein